MKKLAWHARVALMFAILIGTTAVFAAESTAPPASLAADSGKAVSPTLGTAPSAEVMQAIVSSVTETSRASEEVLGTKSETTPEESLYIPMTLDGKIPEPGLEIVIDGKYKLLSATPATWKTMDQGELMPIKTLLQDQELQKKYSGPFLVLNGDKPCIRVILKKDGTLRLMPVSLGSSLPDRFWVAKMVTKNPSTSNSRPGAAAKPSNL